MASVTPSGSWQAGSARHVHFVGTLPLEQLPQTRTTRKGGWTGYDDTTQLAVRRGARLTVEDIPPRLAQHARDELATLRTIGSPATGELPMQVGVPCYLDMTRLVAGIAHENQSRVDQLAVRTLVEQAVGTTVDVATSCGLGRRTPEQADQAIAAMRALLTG